MLDSHGATRHALIQFMLGDVFDWQHHLRLDAEMPDSLAEPVAEHGLLIRPDFGFYAEDADGDDEPDDETADAAEDEDSPRRGRRLRRREAAVPGADQHRAAQGRAGLDAADPLAGAAHPA
jgi:hypothetical protein